MNHSILVEIVANSIGSALAAQEGGAHRIELCEFLEGGGVTPSYGTIARTRDCLTIPLFVLIRPRIGDFCFDENELAVMLHDIEMCRRLGCDGVVIGALTSQGEIDMAACQQLCKAAGALSVTFHRAFDCARDHEHAFAQVQHLGIKRLLTSGGADSVAHGTALIRKLVDAAPAGFNVLAGGGVDAGNARQLVRETGVREIHTSAKRLLKTNSYCRDLAGLDGARYETDAALVQAFVSAAQG